MFRIFFSLFLILSVLTNLAQSLPSVPTDSIKPFVIGQIIEIQSNELNEKRILNIYLPEGYNANDTTHYPVIYLLDGSANEDFIHIVGLVQFNSFEWISNLRNSIVVGIANVDRVRDFTFQSTEQRQNNRFKNSGRSNTFISFIEKELQPFIKNTYKTTSEKTIIGQSLGGLLATEILLTKPSLFNKYIIVSPSLWWNNGSLLNQAPATIANTGIYIGVGKEGLTPAELTAHPRSMEGDARSLAQKLKALNKKDVTVYFDYLPKENHAGILHQAVSNAIKCFARKAVN